MAYDHGTTDPGLPDSALGVPLADTASREAYAHEAASTEKLPFSDIPANSPPDFQDFLTKMTMAASGAAPDAQAQRQSERYSASQVEAKRLGREARLEADLEAAGADPNDPREFVQHEASRIVGSTPPDGGLFEPKPVADQPKVVVHPGGSGWTPRNPPANTSAWGTSNFGGSPKDHRGKFSPAPGSTLNDLFPTVVKDEILSNLIAGRSGPYIQRLIKAKYNLLISTDAIYHYKNKEPYRSIVTAGRELRYDAVRQEGLALIDERVIVLQHNAEQLLLRIDEVMSTGGVPPVVLMKEFRETLDDIALELGHRRKGLDVDNSIKVAVVRGPQKALNSEAWAAEAETHSLDEGSSEGPLEQPSASSDSTPRVN